MQEYYYTLTVRPSSHLSLFCDFLSDTVPIGFEEIDGGFVIRSEDELETIGWGIEQFCEALQKALATSIDLDLTYTKEQNSDWVAAYQQSVTPVAIEPFYIHPTWDEPKGGAINIAIDPTLAFGTGHHPTTATCLKAVAKHVQANSKVLDVGCGSGILGIAALKLGAAVDACDTDLVCVDNSKVNAGQNGVAFGEVWEGSAALRNKTYDVVIANIVADVLVMIASDLKAALKDGGKIILSGILDKYEAKVTRAFSSLELVERIPQDEWVTLIVKK
ncbi:MAG: 50S ribosomal protein L11 methyltransferase [Campylobacterota bacterium]|nr:50S ribosomal protein L11 methyltransferase [Campylobacterota bacterium]